MKRLQNAVLCMIARYQRGGGGLERIRVDCNFEPTCSEYTRQAVERFGVWRGLRLGLARVRRCNQPDLVQRVADPVPERCCGEGSHV